MRVNYAVACVHLTTIAIVAQLEQCYGAHAQCAFVYICLPIT